MWNFPARYMARFFERHGLLELRSRPRWFTIAGGSHHYVAAIASGLAARLRLSTPVRAIERSHDRVTITADGEAERFDEVVIATHADQALRLLRDPSRAEVDVLGSIPFQENEAVLHTDVRLLPRRRAAWASWNYHLLAEARGRATLTYYMNKLQRLDAREHFCVTLNRTDVIDPSRIIRSVKYSHPVYTPATEAAQLRHSDISGHNRTHYCGAYWGWGFHEDGVASAVRVAARFGVKDLG
jgi:predicted NAD/FAD-binding protein